ncbi:MAG: ribbon-helix-helix protein, CopG family [Actinobacteria bacterium]|nr:ribbon-helix-helix protein, CopG family [Actinomycetota bacterium]
MIRTQIQLTEDQAARVRRIAAERGVSVAEVIREAVDRLPDRDDRAERWARALAAVGKGHDREGATDVSARHDDYLAEAYAE